MKIIFIILATFVSFFTLATTKISIADGDWSADETWSPAGQPMLEDTVIINTDVVADVYVDVFINTLIVNNGKTLEGNESFALHGNLFNYGTIDLYILAIGDGTITKNEGLMKGKYLGTGNPLFENITIINTDSLMMGNTDFVNMGLIDNFFVGTSERFFNENEIKTNHLSTSGTFTNDGPILTDTLITSGNFINNSDIRTGALIFAGNVSGINGKFCVRDCFLNLGSVSGDLDICDETATFCDINEGAISGSVTFCEASPCATVAVEENEMKNSFKIYPNPASDFLMIALDQKIAALVIYSADGKLIYEQNNIQDARHEINVSNYPFGTYYVIIRTENGTEQAKFCVNH